MAGNVKSVAFVLGVLVAGCQSLGRFILIYCLLNSRSLSLVGPPDQIYPYLPCLSYNNLCPYSYFPTFQWTRLTWINPQRTERAFEAFVRLRLPTALGSFDWWYSIRLALYWLCYDETNEFTSSKWVGFPFIISDLDDSLARYNNFFSSKEKKERRGLTGSVTGSYDVTAYF